MAYQATTHRSTFSETFQHIIAGITRGFGGFGKSLMEASEGNRLLMQAQALQAKSDAELAALNIKRDQIVERVFGRSF